MLPIVVWKALFWAALPFALWRALRDPAWAAAIAAYFYFAIPLIEFQAPELPWQAAFWALAAITCVRHRTLLKVSARDVLEAAALEAARAALDVARPILRERLVDAAARAPTIGDVRFAALAAAEPPTIEASDAHAPRALSAEVRRGVLAALEAAATLGEKECRATAAHVHATRGVLRAALDERVGRALDTFLDAEALAFVRAHVTKRLDADDAERGSAEGPLGMPMPRGAIAALLSNAGLWAHGIFTVLTYHGAQNAQYSHYKAVLKFELCKLLFIPLVAIVCAIRDVRHVKLFVAAWAFGTLHLTMNAVTWWLQHGGRADNPGGQGGEANFLGAIIVTIAPVTYGLVLNGRTERARAAAVLVAGLFTLGILASGSRGALIALIAGGGYWLVHTNRKGLAAGGTMIAIACILVAAPIEFWQRMATIAGQSDRNPWVVQKEEESKHERTVLWALAVDLWREEPLWGIGPGNYTTVSAERTTFVDAYAGKRGLQAHNTWLQLLAEYGSIGAFVWAGAFFYAMMCYRRARKRLKGYSGWEWFPAMCLGLEAGALANAVTCTFNSFQWYDYHYWHFVFGPITLQVARETAERLDWLAPAPRA